MPLNALILGAPDVVSAGIARGWQMAGHRIAAIWYPERMAQSRDFAQDRALARTAPGVTLHGLAERGGVQVRAVPPLAAWSEANAEAAVLAVDVVISLMFIDRIPGSFLNAFPGRVVNLHPSLLPAYRGRYPTFNMLWDRAIDRYGGASLHVVAPEFDGGEMIAQAAAEFPADRNLTAYFMYLVKAGTGLLNERLPLYLSGQLDPVAQRSGDAPQNNRRPSQAFLTAAHSADDVEWLCAVIPQMTPLRIEGAPLECAVASFLEKSGAPTGAPLAREDNVVDMDVRDARVRLRLA